MDKLKNTQKICFNDGFKILKKLERFDINDFRGTKANNK
jgi:hypothetical protein